MGSRGQVSYKWGKTFRSQIINTMCKKGKPPKSLLANSHDLSKRSPKTEKQARNTYAK